MGGFVGSPKPGSARAAIEAQAQRIRATGPAAPIALATGVQSLVDFVVEDYKNGITHSNGVNPQNFTIVAPGFYLVTALLTFAFSNVTPAPATGLATRINVDGVLARTNVFLGQFAADDIIESKETSDIVEVVAGQVITIGATANFADGGVTVDTAVIAIHRLS